MKKFFAAFLALALLTALCACAPAEGENSSLPESSFEPEERAAESSESSEEEKSRPWKDKASLDKQRVVLEEDGSYTLLNEDLEIVATGLDYDFIKVSDSEYFSYLATVKTDKTRKVYTWHEGFGNWYFTESSDLYLPLDENGKPLIPEPLEYIYAGYYYDLEVIAGALDGNAYVYIPSENGFTLHECYEGKEFEAGFGYILRSHYYGLGYPYCGLFSADGEMIIDYSSRIKVPFEDRFVIYDRYDPIAGFDERRGRLFDKEGNELTEPYDDIVFSSFDDGSYFGIALRIRDGEDCFDKDGTRLPLGYWFIDKDGNVLSECYLKLCIGDILNFEAEDKDEIIYAVHEDGTVESFPVRDILQKQN